MKLLQLEIQNFGKLSGYTLNLSGGLNTLCENNGWGKSTLAVFIKAMLWGLPATRKTDLDFNERRKYAPWGGGIYGGSLSFESKKGRFRIERTFGVKEAQDEFRLFDLDTGLPSDAYGPDLGTDLFGIDADGFERSAYLSERSLTPQSENATILTKLTGLIENPDDIGCYDDAQGLIDKRRRFYEVKGGRGRIDDLTTEYEECRRRLSELREKSADESAAAEELRKAEEKTAAAERALNEFRDRQSAAENSRLLREQYRSLQGDLALKEAGKQEITDLFGGAVPTEAELEKSRNAITEYRNLQRGYESADLSEDERRHMEELSECFPSGIPTPADFDRADKAERNYSQAQSDLQKLKEPFASPAVLRIVQTGIPTKEQLDHYSLLIADADKRAEEERSPHINARPVRRIPLFLPILSALCGVGILALLAIPSLALQPIPLVLGGLALLIGALILFLAGGAPKAPSRQTERKPSSAEILAPVVSLLNRYGMHREGGNCRDELTEFTLLCTQARSYETTTRQNLPIRQALKGTLDQAQNELDRFFRSFGLKLPPQGDTVRTLTRLRGNAEELTNLRRRSSGMQEKKAGLETALNAKKAALQEFFKRFRTERAGGTPEDCQKRIEERCMEYRQLQKDLTDLQKKVREFYQTNRKTLDTPEPPAAEIDPNAEKQLRQTLDAARREESGWRSKQMRLSELTAEIPTLNDRIAYLDDQRRIARANLTTLRKTAQHLKSAKETLSTRYLGGMQAAFERRLDLLGRSTSVQAIIDPQLSLTVREGGVSRSLATASHGTRDLLQFCARLALTEVLSEDGEKPFLLLDDPFVNFDGEHLRAATAYLRALGKEMQILYFVCHESRSAEAEV